MRNVLGVLFVVLFMLFALTKTQEYGDENCGQYNDCSSCITKHRCQYVSWESKERIVPDVKKCVDITLSESEVQQLGPLGNDKNDTHWEMKSFHDEMKCHIHHAKKALSHVKNIAKGKPIPKNIKFVRLHRILNFYIIAIQIIEIHILLFLRSFVEIHSKNR